jgi:hypothetical protein
MARKVTRPPVSTLASKGLRGEKLTPTEQKRVYASALGQDETKGKGSKKP